jgi:uncharacterized protein (TIGR00369 family)
MTTTRDWGQSRHHERAELLGYEVSYSDTGSVAHWRPTAFMSNSMGRVHGGLVGTLVDDVCAMALRAVDQSILASPTVSMHIDYLRPLAIGADYVCTGEVLRVGGRLAVADVKIVDAEGVVCVRGTGTFAVSRGQ